MINRTRCLFYEVGGVYFKDLSEAQKADLMALLAQTNFLAGGESSVTTLISEFLLANSESVARILTTTPRSRARKPRADKGKPHKKAAPATA